MKENVRREREREREREEKEEKRAGQKKMPEKNL